MAKTTQPSAGERDPLLPSSASPPPYLDAHPADSYAVLLVPVRIRRRLRRGCGSRCLGPLLTILAILALAGFLLWPADPDVSVARLRLEDVSVAARPAVAVTISAALKVRVRNPDLFGLNYSRLAVDIGYRGAKLGRVTSGGGHVRARAVSYIDADLHLNGIRVVEDAFYLLEDLARGSVPFDTVVEVEGHLRFFFLSIPVKAVERQGQSFAMVRFGFVEKEAEQLQAYGFSYCYHPRIAPGRISCVVHVNPHNQTILHQDCYPE